jgi:SAM-dependent methyltransferase
MAKIIVILILITQSITKLLNFLLIGLFALKDQFKKLECLKFSDNLLLHRLKAKKPRCADRDLEYPWMLDNINISEGKILDVGSTACDLLYNNLSNSIEVNGINLNKQKNNNQDIKLKTGDIRKTDYSDNYFDVITCISTLEHIGVGGRYNSDEDPTGDQKAMDEMYRILKPKGILLLTVPYGAKDVLPINKLYNKERTNKLFEKYNIVEKKHLKYSSQYKIWLNVNEEKAAKVDMMKDGWYALGFFKLMK